METLRTGFAGRSYRGRNFIGGLHENWVLGATVQGGRVTAQQAYYTALKTAYVTPDELSTEAKLFVFSRLLASGQPDADPPVAPVSCQNAGANVLSTVTKTTLATMKTRKAGSGL